MERKDAKEKKEPRKPVRFAEELKELREDRRLSQRELSRRTGLSPLRISRLENGHVSPRLPELADLAAELAVTLDRLVFGEEPGKGRLDKLLEELKKSADRATLRVVERILAGLVGPQAAAPSAGSLRIALRERTGAWR